MDDTEIIKALECHQNTRPTCAECPFHTRPEDCLEQLQRSALVLIYRQQTEIENLKEVKHGHWIPQFVSSRGLTDKFVCSVCNTTSYTNRKYLNCSYKYCKECGAKMEKFGNPE